MKKKLFEIRDMMVEDLSQVFNLGIKELDMSKIYHQFWNLRELVSIFESDKELCIVAESNRNIVGFALGRKRFSMWNEDSGYFEWIVVSKDYQRKGLGSALCEEMLRRFNKHGVKRVIADVEGANVSKILLEGFSFKKIFSVDWFVKEM